MEIIVVKNRMGEDDFSLMALMDEGTFSLVEEQCKAINKRENAERVVIVFLFLHPDNQERKIIIKEVNDKYPDISEETIGNALLNLSAQGIVEKPEYSKYVLLDRERNSLQIEKDLYDSLPSIPSYQVS